MVVIKNKNLDIAINLKKSLILNLNLCMQYFCFYYIICVGCIGSYFLKCHKNEYHIALEFSFSNLYKGNMSAVNKS